MESKLFTPCSIGPLTLKNRTIRSAAFEGMCQNYNPTSKLADYHISVAKGGVGMTTLAYASVSHSGLSFKTQLWLREEVVDDLRRLTDQLHELGTKVSIQIGHCGNMAKPSTAGQIPVSASSGFNLYSYSPYRRLKVNEIEELAKSYGTAVDLARRAGFDAVEVHAGHGYLISQFLSPYTNRRKDQFGGDLESRMHFMDMCIGETMEAARGDMAVLVKTNMRDGFRGGNDIEEGLTIAKRLEQLGVHALVLSGGFVSRAPMYVMGGDFPVRTITHYMPKSQWWLKAAVGMFGRIASPSVPFKELFFLDDALRFRKELTMPLVYVGGVINRADAEKVLDSGFEFMQFGRALFRDPDFVNRMRECDSTDCSCGCGHSNFCIGRMYTIEACCHHHVEEPLTKSIKREIAKSESK